MPIISMFYGIVVMMFFMDRQRHRKSHIHARYQSHEAVFCIKSGEVLEGSLPQPKIKLVQAWIEIHRDELLADWDLAVSGEPVFKIKPLR